MKTSKIDRTIFVLWMMILASCIQQDKQDLSLKATSSDDGLLFKDTITSESFRIENIHNSDTIEIINSPYTDSVHLEIRITQKDWFEDIFLIRKNLKMTALPVSLPSQSILFASFVNLQRSNSTFFEVFDITHMGNGFYNLFEYKNGKLRNLLTTRAVDRNQEGIGLTADSSFIIQNDRLKSEYLDLNEDGFLDIKLSGIGYVIKGDVVSDEEKLKLKNPISLERQFIWNNSKHEFEEALDKRIGFWYYDKYDFEF